MNAAKRLVVVAFCLAMCGARASTISVAPEGGDCDNLPAAVAAANAAIAGGEASVTINVAEGTYAITARLDLTGPITLVGAGPTKTIIDCSTKCKVYVNHKDAVLSGVTVTRGNPGWGSGGNVWMDTAGGLVTNCHLVACYNYPATFGGGLCANGGLVTHCLIKGNQISDQRAAGAYISNAILRDSVICCNTNTAANWHAGGVWAATGALIENCTIFGNVAQKSCGLYSDGGKARNCVIWDNHLDTGAVSDFAGTEANITYSCFSEAKAETNTAKDPQIADADGRLADSSPCVNTGSNQDWMIGAKDFAGVTRILQNTVDMGAYELFQSQDDVVEVGGSPEEIGVVSPAYGSHAGWTSGQSEAFSAPAAVTNGATSVLCVGYRIYDIDDATGAETEIAGSPFAGNSFTYTHGDSHRKVVWQFGGVMHLVTVAAAGGTVELENDGWYAEGTTVTLTAVPDEGRNFDHWEGEGVPPSTSPTLTVRVDGPLALTAVFRKVSKVITVAPTGADYASVVAAVAAAKEALAVGEESVVITVAEGEYALTEQIDLDGPITVSGAGMGQTILKRDPSVASMRIAYLHHEKAVLEKATLRDGRITASDPAGGVLINAGTLQDCEVVNCALAHWSTWQKGSCVRLDGANARILRCSLHDNSTVTASDSWGTGLALFIDGNGVADSCLIYNNGNENGNSSYAVRVANGTLRNCTVTDNYFAKSPAVYVDNNNNNSVIDCVICDNRGITPVTGQILGNGFDLQAANAAMLAKCVRTVVENPGFMNAAVRDYRLSPASPYVDTGSDGSASLTATDLTGVTPRLCDAAVDPGCYEANRGTTPACFFTCAQTVRLTGQDFTLKLYSANAGDDPEYTLDWGDGTVEPVRGATATHAYGASGAYTVKLSLAGAADYEIENFLTAQPKDIFVSTDGTAEAPFDAIEKATPNIEDALAYASEGATVWVAEGAYKFSKAAQICIRTDVKVVGLADDPAKVVFSPNKANTHRMFLLGNANAGLYNLTIQGGFAEKQQIAAGDCVYIESTGGTVSNCVMRNVNDTKWGNVAAGVCMQGGLVTHCVLSNLVASAAENNRPGMVASIAGGSMENCLITQNKGTGNAVLTACGIVSLSGNGRLVNCTVAGNQMSGPSGLFLQSTTAQVINCLIGDNKSTTVAGDTVTTYVGYSDGKAIDVTDCFVNCAAGIKINDTCKTGNLGFADAVAHDYHIILGSCAQDAGTVPAGYVPPAVDLDGADRMDDGKIDIGCYELHVSGIVATFKASAAKGAAPVEVTFEADVAGADPSALTYAWDVFGDGSEIVQTTGPKLVYTYEKYGDFTAKLVVYQGGAAYPALNTQPFTSYPGNMYVNAASEAPESPYDTPEKAAQNIPDAVALASDDSVVHVSPGTYAVPVITLDAGITVAGETGRPEDVVLKPAKGDKSFRPFTLNHPGAKVLGVAVDGFTAGDNYAYGKGFYVDGLGGTVSNCVIRNCRAPGWATVGGGVYMCGPGLVTHCVISNCQASSNVDSSRMVSGTAVYMTDGTVRNCLMTGNYVDATDTGTAVNGGTVAMKGGRLENCTVAKNTTRASGGVYAEGTAKVVNCVIACNATLSQTGGANLATWGGTAACFETCVTDGEAINDSCAVDAAPYAAPDAGDFTLAPGGTAIDFAQTLDWMTEGAIDLAGNPRIDGDAPDAGCYEAKAGVFSASVRTLSETRSFAPVTVDFAVTVVNAGDQGYTCAWYEGDAAEPFATTTTDTFRYVRDAYGTVAIRLVVTDNASGTVYPVPGYVEVYAAPRKVYVVPEGSAVESREPYASWETAATSIGAAYGVALPGAEIVLGVGVYTLTEQMVLGKAVTVTGCTGRPEDVELRVSTNNNRLFYVTHKDAVISSLTMEGKYWAANKGTSPNEGALVRLYAGGTVTNCILRNGHSTGWDCCGGAAFLDDGVMTHCVITNNFTSSATAGAAASYRRRGMGVFMQKGRMENCLVAYNGCSGDGQFADLTGGAVAMFGGSLVNCTVVANRHPGCAGVYADGGTVANCLIVGNESTVSGGEASVWRGTASCFTRCLGEVKINDSCLTGSTEVFKPGRAKRGVFIPLGSSAARDAGDVSFVSEATDLYGKPRVFGGKVDLGCAESQSGGLMIYAR